MWINLWIAIPVLSVLALLMIATTVLVIRETRSIRQAVSGFEFVTNNIADLAIRIDQDYRIIWLNPASLLYFGQESSFCVGKDLFQLLEENYFLLDGTAVFDKAFESGRAAVIETTMARPGESEHFLEIKILPEPVKGRAARQALIIIRDITVRKETEISLFKAKAIAEENDRKKSAFLASMSHEMRTPLNAIVGFSQILVEEGLSEEEKTRYFEYINQNNNLLIDLVNDIIDISKLESNQLVIRPSQFNLHSELDEIREIIENEKRTRGKTHLLLTLDKAIDDESFLIKTDALRLRQILINLLVNAVKFTPKGYIQFGYRVPEAGRLLFFVRDTGIGIPEDRFEDIFQYFKQLEPSSGRGPAGTGLGLAICRHLVSLMGGAIWVESEVGKGSVFYFSLAVA